LEQPAEAVGEADHGEMRHELAELRDIESAQRRILQDVYGRCAGCGTPIAWARLDAYPTATCCLSCQTRREQSA
jgi:RNA polymerase-binding transcription factor DksA